MFLVLSARNSELVGRVDHSTPWRRGVEGIGKGIGTRKRKGCEDLRSEDQNSEKKEKSLGSWIDQEGQEPFLRMKTELQRVGPNKTPDFPKTGFLEVDRHWIS